MTDFDTGQRHVLIQELTRYDQSIELGPMGRFAIVAGCDANAWLAAVGTLSSDGTIEIVRLEDTPGARQVRGNNNAGTNLTWSPDGEILYFNTTSADAATGHPLPTAHQDLPLTVHAGLADGSRLVSHRGASDPTSSFWLLDAEEPMDLVPERPPLFRGEAAYPAARIALSADGRYVAITIDRWGPTERTLLVGPQEVRQLSGAAAMTPDWSQALIQTGGTDGGPSTWAVVDLATGTATVVPTDPLKGHIQQIVWAGNETGLLISTVDDELRQDTPLQIWYTELTR